MLILIGGRWYAQRPQRSLLGAQGVSTCKLGLGLADLVIDGVMWHPTRLVLLNLHGYSSKMIQVLVVWHFGCSSFWRFLAARTLGAFVPKLARTRRLGEFRIEFMVSCAWATIVCCHSLLLLVCNWKCHKNIKKNNIKTMATSQVTGNALLRKRGNFILWPLLTSLKNHLMRQVIAKLDNSLLDLGFHRLW